MDAGTRPGEHVDIGWDRPVSMQEVAGIVGRQLKRRIGVQAVPALVLRLAGLVVPGMRDLGAMVDWSPPADTTRQAELFGPPPTAEDAIARFARSLGHEPA